MKKHPSIRDDITSRKLSGILLAMLCALAGMHAMQVHAQQPTGPSVVAGTASFATSGNRLTVTNSPNAIINWQSFSIGAGNTTRFEQQSSQSTVLNRVVEANPSVILGTLSSNGNVFLVNPNGILFGAGSRVDVGGLVASTLALSDSNFLAGNFQFGGGAPAGSLDVQGAISSGSYAALIGASINLSGSLTTVSGAIGGGTNATLDIRDNQVTGFVATGAGQVVTVGVGGVNLSGPFFISGGGLQLPGSGIGSGTLPGTGPLIRPAGEVSVTPGATLIALSGSNGASSITLGNPAVRESTSSTIRTNTNAAGTFSGQISIGGGQLAPGPYLPPGAVTLTGNTSMASGPSGLTLTSGPTLQGSSSMAPNPAIAITGTSTAPSAPTMMVGLNLSKRDSAF